MSKYAGPSAFGCARLLRARLAIFGFGEGGEHGKSALEQSHVLPRLLLHRLESGGAEGIGELPSIFFLLARQRLKAEFEIFGHELLDRMAVEPDKLAQKPNWEEGSSRFSLLPPQ